MPEASGMQKRTRSLVAEFVVVVVGVLVALAADSAMDRVRENDDRRAALESLRRDVLADLAELDNEELPFLADQDEARVLLETLLGGQEAIHDSVRIVTSITILGMYPTFDPNTAAIDYLTSTGRLELIEAESLRSSILGYYNSIENFAELDAHHAAAAIASEARWAGVLVGALATSAYYDVRWRDADPDELRRESARALDAASLRSSDRLRRFLVERTPPLDSRAAGYTRLRSAGVSLIEMLDQTLDGAGRGAS
jgi:hypothetical protein